MVGSTVGRLHRIGLMLALVLTSAAVPRSGSTTPAADDEATAARQVEQKEDAGSDDAPSFAGLWDTDFGRLRIVQRGSEVEGIYEGEGGGELSGTAGEGRLEFTYREVGTRGSGWFALDPDGERFSGEWRARGEQKWSPWRGRRVKPKPRLRWLIVIESRWETAIREQEYTFGRMLESFFSRTPQVNVRHRVFNDEPDLQRWLRAAAYLAEPTVVVVASHGSAKGVRVGNLTIAAPVFAEPLRFASNVVLLHFSACRLMRREFGADLFASLGDRATFAVSGYSTSVDWATSAVADFLYLDLVLVRRMEPAEAARQLPLLMPIAGDAPVEGTDLRAAGFRMELPPR